MKFGLRIPNLNKRIATKTSLKRYVRQNLGFKAPRGWGWVTNPKKPCITGYTIEQLQGV